MKATLSLSATCYIIPNMLAEPGTKFQAQLVILHRYTLTYLIYQHESQATGKSTQQYYSTC